ncbi:unnamed protein product [Dicrocoelium dendriticum]|nr:unnamed protein product [Dicrocoelium dendriticum]
MVVVLTGLISLSCLSLVSVVSYAGLALLCCTTAARLYAMLLCPKNSGKTSKSCANDYVYEWLTADVKLPTDRITDRVTSVSSEVERYLIRLQRLLLLKNYADALKFLLLLYLLHVLGDWFNLLTVVTIGFVLLFTLPRVYYLNQKQFDSCYSALTQRASALRKKMQPVLEKIPGYGK